MVLFRLTLSDDRKAVSVNRFESIVERLDKSELLDSNGFDDLVTPFESLPENELGGIGGVPMFGGIEDNGEDTEDEDEDGEDGTEDTRCGQSGPLREVVALA
jgi:hypothetical protein